MTWLQVSKALAEPQPDMEQIQSVLTGFFLYTQNLWSIYHIVKSSFYFIALVVSNGQSKGNQNK